MALRVAGLLVLYNNLNNLLPESTQNLLYIPLNLTVALLLILWARYRGYSWPVLGFSLSRDRLFSALRWGILLGVALPAPVFLALVLPEPVSSLADARDWDELQLSGLAYQTLLRIPLGTALFEEVAFRGVVYGIWRETAGTRRALIGSSVAFGLWHVAPTVELLQGSDLFGNSFTLELGVAGGVFAAFLGGLFFAWIRLRTGGVYGPILTHWLISALAALAAFVVVR